MEPLHARGRGSSTPAVSTSALMRSRLHQLTYGASICTSPLEPHSGLHQPSPVSTPPPSDTLHAPPAPETSPLGPLAALPISAAIIAAAASAALALQAEPAIAETLTGAPRVVDGDTLEFGSERVRLYGVDAPESKQSCKDRSGKDFPCGAPRPSPRQGHRGRCAGS